MAEQRWVFVVKSLDQPGALTTAASTFSNRGVSLEAILGSGIAATRAEDARLVLIFRATERKKEMLLRVLERLAAVIKVDAYLYNDPQLRAIAVIKVTSITGIDFSEVTTEFISETDTEQMMLLTGNTVSVERLIDQLRHQDQLLDAVTTVIAM